jgi:hypothetical protein
MSTGSQPYRMEQQDLIVLQVRVDLLDCVQPLRWHRQTGAHEMSNFSKLVVTFAVPATTIRPAMESLLAAPDDLMIAYMS